MTLKNAIRRLFGRNDTPSAPALRNKPGPAFVVKCENPLLMGMVGRPVQLVRFLTDRQRWETDVVVFGRVVGGPDSFFTPLTPPPGEVSESEVRKLYSGRELVNIVKERL